MLAIANSGSGGVKVGCGDDGQSLERRFAQTAHAVVVVVADAFLGAHPGRIVARTEVGQGDANHLGLLTVATAQRQKIVVEIGIFVHAVDGAAHVDVVSLQQFGRCLDASGRIMIAGREHNLQPRHGLGGLQQKVEKHLFGCGCRVGGIVYIARYDQYVGHSLAQHLDEPTEEVAMLLDAVVSVEAVS